MKRIGTLKKKQPQVTLSRALRGLGKMSVFEQSMFQNRQTDPRIKNVQKEINNLMNNIIDNQLLMSKPILKVKRNAK